MKHATDYKTVSAGMGYCEQPSEQAPVSGRSDSEKKRMAYPRGLEPLTFWSVARRSIQLSYGYADFGCIGYFNKRAKELQVYTLKSIGQPKNSAPLDQCLIETFFHTTTGHIKMTHAVTGQHHIKVNAGKAKQGVDIFCFIKIN